MRKGFTPDSTGRSLARTLTMPLHGRMLAVALVALAGLLVTSFGVYLTRTNADGGDFHLDYASAIPTSYDHTTSPAVETSIPMR